MMPVIFMSNVAYFLFFSAYGRQIVYDHMTKIEECGGTVYAVDVDGIFYSLKNNEEDPLTYSNICGDFKNVIGYNNEIIAFYCLGTRNYSILYKTKDQELKSYIRIKGLSLSSHCIDNVISPSTYKSFLKNHFNETVEKIIIPQERFCIDNATKVVKKKYQHFTFQNDLYIKRYVNDNNADIRIPTFPFGFKK